MREMILQEIVRALKNRTEFFIREEDIQIYLTNHFLNSGIFDQVFFEYHVPADLVKNYPWKDVNNIYIDIVLEKQGLYYPLEIKFKTKSQVLPHKIFGEEMNVHLGQHGAQNIGCYDFWKDVKRIELFEEIFPKVRRGVVLFVSNDPSYQKPPLNNETGYAQFSIYEGHQIQSGTTLNWNGNPAIAEGRPEITTRCSYVISWAKLPLLYHQYILI